MYGMYSRAACNQEQLMMGYIKSESFSIDATLPFQVTDLRNWQRALLEVWFNELN